MSACQVSLQTHDPLDVNIVHSSSQTNANFRRPVIPCLGTLHDTHKSFGYLSLVSRGINYQARPKGIEPSFAERQSAVLPLHHGPEIRPI